MVSFCDGTRFCIDYVAVCKYFINKNLYFCFHFPRSIFTNNAIIFLGDGLPGKYQPAVKDFSANENVVLAVRFFS